MIDYLTATIVLLAGAALLLPLLQLTKGRSQSLAGYVLALVLAAALLLVGAFTFMGPGSSSVSWAGSLLHPDQLGGVFALVTLGVTLAVTVASFDFEKSAGNPVYYSLLGFTALGMVLLAYSQDLLMLFVSWELMSVPTYVLAGFSKTRQSNEASVKYAIIGAMSSAIILYAISLAYGLTGSTQITAVVSGFMTTPTALAGVATLLFVAGFGFKMSVVPFHMWIPDAYEGAPTTISTLLAAATKKAGFIAAIRVLLAITTLFAVTRSPIFTMANVFAVLAIVTMTVGNVSALTQKSMTRLLAYSSIAQAGYMLIGFVAVSNAQGTTDPSAIAAATLGLTGTIFHVINHAAMKGVAFLAAALVLLQLRRADLGVYDGLAKRMPITAFTLAVAFLGLAGVPPLSGFWSKLLLILSVASGPYAWLALAAILNSAFSLGYYAWIIKRMYIDEGESAEKVKEPFWFVMVFAVMVGLIIGIGLFPQQVIGWVSSAASSVVP